MKLKVIKTGYVSKLEKSEVEYNVEDISLIVHGKYKTFYSKEDIAGNGVRPNDSVMVLYFKDGSQASFGTEWVLKFEG